MILKFLQMQAQRFRQWWRAPPTPKDRRRGALVGAFGCFWIGLLSLLIFAPFQITLVIAITWALASAMVGIGLGLAFPKVTTCICFPFSTFGS